VVLALKAWREVHPERDEDGKVSEDARVFVREAGVPIRTNTYPIPSMMIFSLWE
jgi:hypothetical protein